MSKSIILFELNEVPYKVVDSFCAMRPRSALAQLLPKCFQYASHTEDVSHLSPWVTWPSVHRGVNDERHCIAEFGQELSAIDKEFPPLWKILAKEGVSVGVCGSLHTYPMPEDLNGYSFYVPDTFAAGKECFPDKLSLFQDFNLRMARESARNVSTHLPWGAALRLLANAPELGFRLKTLADIAGHLAKERITRWKHVRRRTYQAVLAFDVFLQQLRRTKPAFTTFFTNHVASSLHRYWAAAFPTDYENFDYPEEWVDTYSHEIDFTMSKADAMFAELARFVDRNPGSALWVATSMGQHATRASACETQLYLMHPETFMQALGLSSSEWSFRPAMLPQFNCIVAPARVEAVRRAVKTLRIDGEQVLVLEKSDGFFCFTFGHVNMQGESHHAELDGRVRKFEELGLKNVEIDDKSGTCAYHIPQGCLFVYDPTDVSPKAARPTITTLDIAPAILNNFALKIPSYMKQPASIGAA